MGALHHHQLIPLSVSEALLSCSLMCVCSPVSRLLLYAKSRIWKFNTCQEDHLLFWLCADCFCLSMHRHMFPSMRGVSSDPKTNLTVLLRFYFFTTWWLWAFKSWHQLCNLHSVLSATVYWYEAWLGIHIILLQLALTQAALSVSSFVAAEPRSSSCPLRCAAMA